MLLHIFQTVRSNAIRYGSQATLALWRMFATPTGEIRDHIFNALAFLSSLLSASDYAVDQYITPAHCSSSNLLAAHVEVDLYGTVSMIPRKASVVTSVQVD